MERIKAVLWIDDDASKLGSLEDLIEASDIEILVARSVNEALAIVGENREFPLLILDAILPLKKAHEEGRFVAAAGRRWLGASHERDHDAEKGERLELYDYERFEDYERSGFLFQQLSSAMGVTFRKTIVVTYVPEAMVKDIGYRYDLYVNKMGLPEKLERMRAFLSEVLNGEVMEES